MDNTDTDEDFWITQSTPKRAECEVSVRERISRKVNHGANRASVLIVTSSGYQSIPADVKEKAADILQGNLDTFVDGFEEPKRKKLCGEKVWAK